MFQLSYFNLTFSCFLFSDSDFHSNISINVKAGSSKACINFSDLIVDDNIAREGNETFTIFIGSFMATITIVDDDGM